MSARYDSACSVAAWRSTPASSRTGPAGGGACRPWEVAQSGDDRSVTCRGCGLANRIRRFQAPRGRTRATPQSRSRHRPAPDSDSRFGRGAGPRGVHSRPRPAPRRGFGPLDACARGRACKARRRTAVFVAALDDCDPGANRVSRRVRPNGNATLSCAPRSIRGRWAA